jgi:hypothetical protein
MANVDRRQFVGWASAGAVGVALSSGLSREALAANGGDVKRRLPGTWLLTVRFPDGFVARNAIVVTFTSDGGMAERAEARLEGAVGAWEATGNNDQFRFTILRFTQNLTVSKAPGDVAVSFARTQRVRSTNQFIDNSRFTGTATIDSLDGVGNVLPSPPAPPVIHVTQEGARLQVVSE